MRTSLAALIAVVQVAGSWLCCCGADRLLFAQAVPAHATHCEELAVATAEPSACPHCKTSHSGAKQAPGKPSEPPRKHPQLPSQCPCGGMTIESVPAAVSVSCEYETAGPVLESPFPADVRLPSSVSGTTGLAPPGLSELPFLPAEGRLFAHHVLRC